MRNKTLRTRNICRRVNSPICEGIDYKIAGTWQISTIARPESREHQRSRCARSILEIIVAMNFARDTLVYLTPLTSGKKNGKRDV